MKKEANVKKGPFPNRTRAVLSCKRAKINNFMLICFLQFLKLLHKMHISEYRCSGRAVIGLGAAA